MKARNLSPVGSLHPVLFFAGIYVVALLFSIFICSTLFYSCSARSAKPIGKESPVKQISISQESSIAVR